MTTDKKRFEQFWELEKQFYKNDWRFSWWNGAEFGTMLGMLGALFNESACYWWLLGAFCIECGFAYYYLRKNKKILKEMDKLVEGDK